MKRVWGAGILLAILTALCLWGISSTDAASQEITLSLEAAREAAQEENWEKAAEISQICRTKWNRIYPRLCLYISHSKLEAIDQTMALLEPLAAEPSKEQLVAELSRCLTQIRMLKESEYPTLENIL